MEQRKVVIFSLSLLFVALIMSYYLYFSFWISEDLQQHWQETNELSVSHKELDNLTWEKSKDKDIDKTELDENQDIDKELIRNDETETETETETEKDANNDETKDDQKNEDDVKDEESNDLPTDQKTEDLQEEYSDEINYKYDIWDWILIKNYTRQQLASFYINYYEEFLDKELNFVSQDCEFEDEDGFDDGLYEDVIKACRAWIFRGHWWNFYPHGIVSIDEIIIPAIRLFGQQEDINDVQIVYKWNSEVDIYKNNVENEEKNIINDDVLQNYIYVFTGQEYNSYNSLWIVQNIDWKKHIYMAIYE